MRPILTPSRHAVLCSAYALSPSATPTPEQMRMSGLVAQSRMAVVPPGATIASENVSIAARDSRTAINGEDLNKIDIGSRDWHAMIGYWQKTSDIVDGAERMRDQHALYLPQFPNESDPSYTFRWKNAKFTNVYRDIVENLASKPFEQEVTLSGAVNKSNDDTVIPQAFLDFVEDVDGSGNTLSTFAADTFFDGINSTIDWIFVDYSNIEAGTRTVADEKRLGIRPFWSHVKAANVLEVRSKVINGKEQINFFRMLEFEADVKHVRIIERDNAGVWWHLYRELPASQVKSVRFELIDSGVMTIPVIPMVPFVTGRRVGRSWQFRPMLRDAADLQIELFQDESGLKNIKALSGFPILTANGVAPPTIGSGANKKIQTIQVGPETILYAPPSGQGGTSGSWQYIQPDASVMTFLQSDVQKTIDQLRELGRNPLTAQTAGVTVINSATAAKKTSTTVQLWALGLKNALENALVITGMWLNIPQTQYDPEVFVFTDFDVMGSLEDLTALIEARKNGDISRETLWHEMVRRGILSGEFDPELEIERILEDMVDLTVDPNAVDLPDDEPPANVPPVAS